MQIIVVLLIHEGNDRGGRTEVILGSTNLDSV
jgi:hypothetical protein